jgi:hypothetical protein
MAGKRASYPKYSNVQKFKLKKYCLESTVKRFFPSLRKKDAKWAFNGKKYLFLVAFTE